MLKPSRAKRLSDLLPQMLGPAVAKQGFAGAEIVARWEAIVGRDIAARALPIKLAAPPRGQIANPAAAPARSTLTLRVEGAFALEIQHRTPEILERVNAHLGWACVGAVKLRQGAVGRERRKTGPRRLPETTEAEAALVAHAVKAVEEDGLAEALARLGRAALAKGRLTRE